MTDASAPVTLSAHAFREALAHFATGVTIVTARVTAPHPGGALERARDTLVGFTATSFASVSLTPPLVVVCVNHVASAHEGFVRAETFGINVLGEEQSWLAHQFARKGVDRFSGVRLLQTSGTPIIDGAIAQLECRPHARHEVGDHTVVFGEVFSARVTPGRPLLYFARRFSGLGAEPRAGSAASAEDSALSGAEAGE